MTVGTHGSTYGGNPLACAVANAVLDVMLEEGFMERVASAGTSSGPGWRSCARATRRDRRDPRPGLLVGVRVEPPNAEVIRRLRERGMVTAPAADNVVRLFPPLTVSAEEVEIGLGILGEVCAELAAS
jgi:acetylornithine/N-succinyldiaminopimelate aminotransferase